MQSKLHVVALLALVSVDLACSQPTAQTWQNGTTIYGDVQKDVSAIVGSISPNQTDATTSPTLEKNLSMPSTCLDTEDKSGMLCYPKCPNDGHQWTGSGPVCWSKLDSFPYFTVQGRGAGLPLRCPSGQEFSVSIVALGQDAGCYSSCPAGYKRNGSKCYHT